MGKLNNQKRIVLAHQRLQSDGVTEPSNRKIRRSNFRKDNGGNIFALEMKGQEKFIMRLEDQ